MHPNDIPVEDRELYCNRMAENLPILRATLNITQEDVGELLGVTRQTIATIENKQKVPWSNYLALVYVFEREARSAEMLKLLKITPEEKPHDSQKNNENTLLTGVKRKKMRVTQKGMK